MGGVAGVVVNVEATVVVVGTDGGTVTGTCAGMVAGAVAVTVAVRSSTRVGEGGGESEAVKEEFKGTGVGNTGSVTDHGRGLRRCESRALLLVLVWVWCVLAVGAGDGVDEVVGRVKVVVVDPSPAVGGGVMVVGACEGDKVAAAVA